MADQDVLFVATRSYAQPLDIDREFRLVDERLRGSAHTADLRIALLADPDWSELQERLQDDTLVVVHFSVHGDKVQGIVLRGMEEGSPGLGPAEITALFRLAQQREHRNVRLVVLNGCYTAEIAKQLTSVVDVVIGVEGELPDEAAVQFSSTLYRVIGFGRDLNNAYEQAVLTLAPLRLAAECKPRLFTAKDVDAGKIVLAPEKLPLDGAMAKPVLSDLPRGDAPAAKSGTLVTENRPFEISVVFSERTKRKIRRVGKGLVKLFGPGRVDFQQVPHVLPDDVLLRRSQLVVVCISDEPTNGTRKRSLQNIAAALNERDAKSGLRRVLPLRFGVVAGLDDAAREFVPDVNEQTEENVVAIIYDRWRELRGMLSAPKPPFPRARVVAMSLCIFTLLLLASIRFFVDVDRMPNFAVVEKVAHALLLTLIGGVVLQSVRATEAVLTLPNFLRVTGYGETALFIMLLAIFLFPTHSTEAEPPPELQALIWVPAVCPGGQDHPADRSNLNAEPLVAVGSCSNRLQLGWLGGQMRRLGKYGVEGFVEFENGVYFDVKPFRSKIDWLLSAAPTKDGRYVSVAVGYNRKNDSTDVCLRLSENRVALSPEVCLSTANNWYERHADGTLTRIAAQVLQRSGEWTRVCS